jgi:hypothetical protein
MAATLNRPTPEQFHAYQLMYDHFNEALFGGQLPHVILNFSRKAHTLGFFAPERWDNGRKVTHEISLNPSYLREREPRDVAATLVHEMVHLWQSEHGTPSRVGYHNSEWAEKMDEVGLVPSSTGEPGGARVGQKMSHYIAPGGSFARAYVSLPKAARLPWQCGEPGEGRGRRGASPKNKVKYTCPECGVNAWGKPELNLRCGDCDKKFLGKVRRRGDF